MLLELLYFTAFSCITQCAIATKKDTKNLKIEYHQYFFYSFLSTYYIYNHVEAELGLAPLYIVFGFKGILSLGKPRCNNLQNHR